MTALLEARDLAVGYGRRRDKRTVLTGLNLTVQPSEMVCLLGPNGVGKSTLMRTLARALRPLSGTVAIAGSDTARMSPAELARHVGVVLTERINIGAMPAFRLVELGRYPHVNWAGQLGEADREIVREAIVSVGAAHLAHRDISELSDGERQRFMIARALAQKPSVLLLDEPSAFLDVSGRVEMVAMLRHLARDQNIAVILSSHDLDLSLRTADTIWLIDGKRHLHIGAPEDLLADDTFAAVFSGPNVTFSVTDRSFRIRTHPRGRAFVSGFAGRVDFARSVLEREGFAPSDSPMAELLVTVGEHGWTANGNGTQAEGQSFADLARFARRTGEGVQ
ncbi:hypothetical protein ASG47_17855 [Devosia sp. Leaf420]|uniref:ABC transporter ATP-binding protein n=1 Tax=Devosia sp. Leaf420 TaxID=1736374 RepID=UPI0007149D6C|nr:ABC transporter ATP-binding protein [Devosia sp. Leaf420]KQT42788.1 hypothetical protein ASG47_17855 [Devosia sp. Leaf420]